MSETATCRERLAKYCTGNGLDLGFGGDPITPSAICVDRCESHLGRSHAGEQPTHIVGDIGDLYWFADNSLDYVFSSHALEDAVDTTAWLKEWLRVLMPGGKLVLFLPDQQTYVDHCKKNGSLPNQAHAHDDFSLQFVKDRLAGIGYASETIVHEMFPVPGNPYSFDLVVQKPIPR